MPYGNYSYTIDSSFRPFSMQEMLVPFAMYKDEFEKQEAMLDELSKNTDTFKYLEQVAKDNPESKAAQIYNTYASDLRKYGDDFSANGLSMANSRGLRNMKRRYQGEIGRLAKIDEIRRAQIKEQNELRLKDPTRLFSRRADLTDLDKYLENPDLGYESYSGALLAQQVGTAASAIAKGLRDYGNGKPLDGFTRTWLQQHGYTAAEVAQAIQNPALDKTGVLNSIVEQAVQSSGLPQWADASTLNQAYQYARQGLWNAVGQTSVSAYTDEAAKLAASEASQKRVAQYAASLSGQQGLSSNFKPKFDTRNVRTDNDIEVDTKNNANWEKYKKYFYKDPKSGHWKMTVAGMRKYIEKPEQYIFVDDRMVPNPATNPFRAWVDSNGLSEMGQGRTGRYQSERINSMLNRINNTFDTHSDLEYTRNIGAANYDNVISILNHVATDGKISNYKRDRADNGYKYISSDEIDVSALSNGDIKSAHVVYGSHGDFLEVKLKDGTTIMQPFNVLSPTYNAIVQGNRGTLSKYLEAQSAGYTHLPISPDVNVPINDLINAELNSYGDNLISSLHFDEVQPVKVEPDYYGTR